MSEMQQEVDSKELDFLNYLVEHLFDGTVGPTTLVGNLRKSFYGGYESASQEMSQLEEYFLRDLWNNVPDGDNLRAFKAGWNAAKAKKV